MTFLPAAVMESLMRFVKFEWPDWGEYSSFDPGAYVGIVIKRNRTHLLAVFPYRNGDRNFIWFERAKAFGKFRDIIYNIHVRQLPSTYKERLRTWNQISALWTEARAKAVGSV